MNAIGLNPIKLDAIGLDPIRMNAIRLGVLGASSDSGRPYIDPELLSHVKMAISTWGKTNDDPDRAVLKDLSGNGNDMRLLNFGFAEGSGYGLPGTDFEGWLCTDGVDDMIESVKPVSEMLEGSNEITVVSIIHQISFDPKNNLGFTNYINYQKDSSTRMYFRNNISDIGKTGIYGYTYDGTTLTGIYNILGDKADYNTVKSNNIDQSVFNGKLSVCGCTSPGGYLSELSQIAYAGGFIANKVLTTDEINQVIAYYNLDRPGQIIKPQLYYNVKKQGITNENHAEFNEQLIDFLGGHNIQLNNIGWEGESGIIDGALYLDGINDFGKVTGLPVLKDYTVVADYERIRINIGSNGDAAVLSKAESQNNGAFMFNTISNNGEKISYSFGGRNIINTDDTIRRVFYQSKYINNGQYINIIPTFVDSDKLWLGTYRDNDTRFAKLALWSLMLFPYSLSEFLLERQLKKYKAGTLYPDMIEFRPIVKSNIPYSSISYSVNPGVYVTEGSTVTITITLSNASDKLIGVSSNAISDISISGDNGTYEITGKVTKSPQKISIVISSYLTMLGNDTLISNETLIKNE